MPEKPKPSDLSDAAIEMIARRFKVLSDPLRLKLLIAIEEGEKNVSELIEATGSSQTNVSRQLQLLASAGLVSRRKEGQSAFYSIADREVFAMCELVCGSLQKRLVQQSKMAKLFA